MQMQKYLIWLVSGVVGVGAYLLARLAGAEAFVAIILLVVGSLGGSLLGSVLTTPKR